jgi:hypothetical protein
MKINLELNYSLEEEPEQFKSVEKLNMRKIYVWEDKRVSIGEDGSYLDFMRASEPSKNQEANEGLLELWQNTTSVIPPIPDDIWTEIYKSIDYNKAFLEWHPSQKLLKLCWDQQSDSYQAGKVKAIVVELLQSMNLELPPLVKLLCL